MGGARRVIRRRKALFGEKAPFPVAGNRSPENFTAFPPRETVFRAFFPFSRRGKPFFERFFPFPAAGRRFSEIFPHFPRREGVLRSPRSVSRFSLAFRETGDRLRVSVWCFAKSEISFVFQEAE